MTIAEVLLLDYDHEIDSTRRLLERIPENNPSWKPHEKSMPIGRLAIHTARLPDFASQILTTAELDLDKASFPDLVFDSTAQLMSELDRSASEARAHLVKSSDEHLKANWKLSFKGRTILDNPRMLLYRTMFLNHLVHHRAQPGVYLRLQDLPVPGLYGPSADEKF